MRWMLVAIILAGCSTQARLPTPSPTQNATSSDALTTPHTSRVLTYHFQAWRAQQSSKPNTKASRARAVELYHVVRLADSGAYSDLGPDYPKLRAEIERALREAAIAAHIQAKRSRDTRDYVFAYSLYDQHIEVFTRHPTRASLALYRAEVLYTSGKWERAIQGYERALSLGLHESHARVGLAGILYARQKLHAGYSAPASQGLPVQLGGRAQRYLDACTRYIKTFPKDGNVPHLRFVIAMVYTDHGRIQDAEATLLELERAHPSHDLVAKAQKMRAKWRHAWTQGPTP